LDNDDFDIKPGDIYTASIEWDGLDDDDCSRYALFFDNGRKIPLDNNFGIRLSTFEGWKLDFRIHED